MKLTVKGFAENVLFAANIFIVFLLAFEDRITVPYWLQPLGRMHPMVLHFPIVMLMLAMFLEFFRFKETNAKEKIYQNFTSNLLLAGALFSAVTVVMGLFLSLEEGYSGSILQWHKWTGVGIVFTASLIYWCRSFPWYNSHTARAGAILTAACVIIAGHYGATLTHGNNFVLESVTSPVEVVSVPIGEAKVFDHVIMPIFTQKCLSCHNIEKAKGSLMMDDVPSLLKGGKTGKLFVPGKPEISLLLERIHLPLDEKKHMPPREKTQLTKEEIMLLHLWIKNNAELNMNVIDLPADDSLRVMAATFLKSGEASEEDYEFAAADEHVIQRLNTNYRVIYPVAKESPALAVNIYNGGSYKSKLLEDLTPIRDQIISLNLNRIPVSDDDLKIIARFQNLRRLNLNFTAVSDAGLKQLLVLKQLEALSLSGTQVTHNFVKLAGKMSSLRQVTVWNTRVSEEELQRLKRTSRGIDIISGFKDDGKHPIKLNEPRVNTEVSVFKKSMSLQVTHPIKGVQIRYTTDGSEPDSLRSLIYTTEILLKDNTTLKARAYKSGWYGSDVISSNFYKSTYNPDSILFLLPANEKYSTGGAKILTDSQLGNYDINTGNWIGFRENSMEAMLFFRQPVTIQSVSLNVLRQLPTYIFPPAKVEIWGGTDKNNIRLLSVITPKTTKNADKDAFIKVDAKFKPQSISCLKIVARNVKKLPVWHPGKGEPAWLFVDEIFLN